MEFTMPDPRTTLRQMMFRGYSAQSAETTLATLCHLTPEQIHQEFEQFKADLAQEASTVDVLGGLMLNMHQREHALEGMIPKLKDDTAPASLFTAQRMLLKDQQEAWMLLH